MREKRDKQLALEYVKRGQKPGSVPEIGRELGMSRRTSYRAFNRELAWALDEARRLGIKVEEPAA